MKACWGLLLPFLLLLFSLPSIPADTLCCIQSDLAYCYCPDGLQCEYEPLARPFTSCDPSDPSDCLKNCGAPVGACCLTLDGWTLKACNCSWGYYCDAPYFPCNDVQCSKNCKMSTWLLAIIIGVPCGLTLLSVIFCTIMIIYKRRPKTVYY